jgi:OmpA family
LAWPAGRAGVAAGGHQQQYRPFVALADNVVAYFRSQGVNPGILSAKGFGDTHPVASNDTPQGRAQNRRIEIVLEGPGA